MLPVLAFLTVGWAVGLVVGIGWLLSVAREFAAAQRALAPAVNCPRGHPVSQYGVATCAVCRMTSEGLLWICRHCGAHHGHISCTQCPLSIRSPFL